jgi:electron transfer flavoprotein beta subunit
MDIVVCIKRVVDVSQVKIDERTNEPIIAGIPEKTSDFDKNAMEAAIKVMEKVGGSITVVTVGSDAASENIKECLAMGAEKGVILNDPAWTELDTHNRAKVLAAGINNLGNVDLVMVGEASIDSYSGQMAPRLAQLLDASVVTSVRAVEGEADKVVCEVDMGDTVRTVDAPYPAVVSVTKEANEPRLPNLMQILAAGNKPMETKDAGAIGFDNATLNVGMTLKGLAAVTMERKQKIFEGDDAVDQLAAEIKTFLGRS